MPEVAIEVLRWLSTALPESDAFWPDLPRVIGVTGCVGRKFLRLGGRIAGTDLGHTRRRSNMNFTKMGDCLMTLREEGIAFTQTKRVQASICRLMYFSHCGRGAM